MYYPYAGRVVAAQDVRDYNRVFQEIDAERLELAAFAVRRPFLPDNCGAELTRHKDHLHDLTELEEAMMIRTRYVELEPHWRAHRRFQMFLNKADSREDLLFCTDWLRQHEAVEDAEFRQWLRHCCAEVASNDCRDCIFHTDPERILLTVKMQLV